MAETETFLRVCVCVLLLQDLLQSCSRGGGRRMEDMWYERRYPHRPRLVVSRSTCPPLSSPPHANSFVIGPAVIKHTHLQVVRLVLAVRSLDSGIEGGAAVSLLRTAETDLPMVPEQSRRPWAGMPAGLVCRGVVEGCILTQHLLARVSHSYNTCLTQYA